MGLLYNPLPGQQPGFGYAPSSPSSILGPALGRDTSGNFALTVEGLAVRAGDRFVTAIIDDEGAELVDVSSLVISGVDPWVYRLPVTIPSRGDLILISDNPFSVRYVLESGPAVVSLDPATGDVAELIAAQNPFVSFFVKIVSLFGQPPEDLEEGIGDAGGFEKGPAPGHEAREEEREGENMGERPEFNLLLTALLLGQQQCQTAPGAGTAPPPSPAPAPATAPPSWLNLLLLTTALGGGKALGMLELVTLLSVLQPQSAGTGLPGNGMALALLLLTMGRGREGGDRDFFRGFRGREFKEGRGFGPGWPAGAGPGQVRPEEGPK